MSRGRLIAAIAVGLIGGTVLVLTLTGGGHRSNAGPRHPWLWSHSPIRRHPLVLGSKRAPPEPVDRRGVPALLSSDPSVKNAYLRELANRLGPVRPPRHVGFFGHVVSASSGRVVVRREGVVASWPGASSTSAHPWVKRSVVTALVNRRTALLLGGRRASSLRGGSEVFVGGTQNATSLTAELVADPARMQQPDQRTTAAASRPARSDSMSGVRQPAPYRLAAKTTAAATTSNAASPAGAITPSSAPAPADSQQGPDTVELHDKTGAGRLPPFVFNPHFDATVGEGETCELGVHADLLIANDYELHWPFQFLQNGDGFSVVSLDHPEPSSTQGTFGPVHYAKGFTDPSNYTVYSGFGFSSALNAAVTCHLDTPFGRISIPFGVGYGNISLGSVNKTLHHVRLSGDPGGDLQIPPDHCGGASETFGPTNIGIEVCQYQTLGPGLVRATMTGTGGKPQGIAVSYSNGDFVHHGTAPNGGAIRVDQFNYAAPLTVRMVAGLLLNIDPRPFLPFKKGRGASAAQKKAGVFSAAQRHKNQVGPTLPNGHWHDAKNQWYDERENKTSEPADPLGELQRANANWFHPGQDGPTLRDGRFRLKSGGNNPWRNPNGTTAKTPTPQELADYNPLTNSDPSEEEPKATPDDLHGWTYSTTEGDLIAPGNANPASLLLNLPVQPAPAPPPCSKQAARQELATRGLLGSGFTGVATVICGDFSGDGGVAMAFTREVTGSAGTIGWGVFVAEGRKWRLAFVREHETQVGIKAQGRELLRSQPIHRPGDANCCPTGGATIEAYRFRGGTFVKIGESHDPNPHPAGFYVLGPTP